jgi:hypothetical protein
MFAGDALPNGAFSADGEEISCPALALQIDLAGIFLLPGGQLHTLYSEGVASSAYALSTGVQASRRPAPMLARGCSISADVTG